jgi:6-phosphogluconate dehydrogenase
MNVEGSEIGVVGLGTMGRNLALNFADRGFPVSGYDRDIEKVRLLRTEASGPGVQALETPGEFLESLRRPRAVMMLVPAGKPIDSVIRDLSPRLEAGDLLIDGGNSHFSDTDRRVEELSKVAIGFLGVGVSGGEEGARHGPSIMPGGPREAYERVRGIFEAAAARADGEPCVAWLGLGSAGHFVKMVHNGIEYGIMELIAESYDLMHRGLGLCNDELHDVYAEWNKGEMASYLIEITARIFRRVDPESGGRLVDSIRDEAEQLGTGMWTSQVAMDLGVPVPTIDAAVSMRSLSHMKGERERASRSLMGRGEERIEGRIEPITSSREALLEMVGNAFFASVVITYAQGLALLCRASDARGYNLDLETIARIWRGGCIIRAAVLEKIRAAYRAHADLPNLLLDPDLMAATTAREKDLRSIVSAAARAGIPAPAMMASLAYLDAYTSERLPANLIQAQRDYFGAHTYRRIGRDGTFHTDWSEGDR